MADLSRGEVEEEEAVFTLLGCADSADEVCAERDEEDADETCIEVSKGGGGV